MDATTALIGAVAVLIGALSKGLIDWLRTRNEAQVAMRRQLAEERDAEREDTIKIACNALSASEKARQTVEAMLRELYADREVCREEQKRLQADLIRVNDELREVKRENRDLRLKVEHQEKVIEHLRETLVRDYQRRPDSIIPAGPPDEPVLREVKRRGQD